jgi:hypothetical protein
MNVRVENLALHEFDCCHATPCREIVPCSFTVAWLGK